jgi:hypothetical protein
VITFKWLVTQISAFHAFPLSHNRKAFCITNGHDCNLCDRIRITAYIFQKCSFMNTENPELLLLHWNNCSHSWDIWLFKPFSLCMLTHWAINWYCFSNSTHFVMTSTEKKSISARNYASQICQGQSQATVMQNNIWNINKKLYTHNLDHYIFYTLKTIITFFITKWHSAQKRKNYGNERL